MKKWKIGLVGCGTIAYYNYLPEIKEMPNAEVVAVCDIIPERAKRYAEEFNVREWYTDIDEMLKKSDFEILVDTAVIPAHFQINLKALQAGKHLYSQKPITTTVKECEILIDEARRRNLKISASPIHMLRPDIIEAKRLIESGMIGKISFARCSVSHGGPEYFQFRDVDPTWFYKPGGGSLLDLGVHGLHILTGLLGPAKRVTAVSGISEKKRVARSGRFDGKEIIPMVDDNTLLLLDFGEATFGMVDCTYCVKASKSSSLEIFGSKGTITFLQSKETSFMIFIDDIERNVRGWMDPTVNLPRIKQSCGVKDLIDAIEQDREPVLRVEHALHVIEITEKTVLSAREGKTFELETVF